MAGLEQLQSEHADLTHVLIEAKVELAEKQGELRPSLTHHIAAPSTLLLCACLPDWTARTDCAHEAAPYVLAACLCKCICGSAHSDAAHYSAPHVLAACYCNFTTVCVGHVYGLSFAGELLKLVREIKRWRSEASEQNAAGVVNQLENILAVVPSAGDDSDVPQSPASATAASRQGGSFDAARSGGLAGLAAGLGHMREAWGGLGVAGRARTSRLSDSSGTAAAAAGAEGGAAAGAGAAALPRSSSEKPEQT